MRQISLVLLGFGNVGRAFANLILEKKEELAQQYDLELIVTGIATGKHGNALNTAGINLTRALELVQSGKSLETLSAQPVSADKIEFIYESSGNVMIETTPLNPHTGTPAISYIKTGLEKGMHIITANKGPVVHAYPEITRLAEAYGKEFRFESSVMDGAPIFSLFRHTLPLIELKSFTGILNSCTNYLLGLMENGSSFEDAVEKAKAIGIAETDPSADIDGWDASVKVAALVTVLMGIPLKPQQIDRTGIREITPTMIQEAKSVGKHWKLICTARRMGKQLLEAKVSPQLIEADSPLYSVDGTSSFVAFETDVLPSLGIYEGNPGPTTTAYGLLADLIDIVGKK